MKHAEKTIEDLESRLQELDEEAKKIKSAINCLCDVMGLPPKYQVIEEERKYVHCLRADEYYGRPLATVVTEVLEKRETQELGAATLDEIYEQLVAGGFRFIGKNDGIKKRGLAISMSKNQKFHKLPNDTWGLAKWYPDVKGKKETIETRIGSGVVLDRSNENEENQKHNEEKDKYENQ